MQSCCPSPSIFPRSACLRSQCVLAQLEISFMVLGGPPVGPYILTPKYVGLQWTVQDLLSVREYANSPEFHVGGLTW